MGRSCPNELAALQMNVDAEAKHAVYKYSVRESTFASVSLNN